jgi:uncharacterized protein DUF2442
MFMHVIEARHVHDYRVWVRFNDGTSGEVDLSEELEGPVFGLLRDVNQFKRFTLKGHTLSWENGADFAPEFLREHLQIAAA